MRYNIIIFCIIVFSIQLSGQTVTGNMQGAVSFVSSQNVYVKFKSTEGISAGDTLYLSSNGKLIPVLRVNNLSSTSCICTPVSRAKLPVSQAIIAKRRSSSIKSGEKVVDNAPKENALPLVSVDTIKKQSHQSAQKQKINGSLSAYSYSDFSNTPSPQSTRFRYTFTLDARNIANSKISIDSYVSFRHKLGDWSEVKSNVFNTLKIYGLAVRYDPDRTTHIVFGRSINSNISSIGSMDGLQFEKSINRFALGAVVGFRPDYTNYGLNSKLFQYGAYLAFNSKPSQTFSQTSLAFMQQMNNSKTDRRFLYFQHSNSFIKSIYFFSTFEIDLYKLKKSLPQNTFDLTGLYLSLRYRMTKNLTVTGSYDARKNVMYYESYKTLIDSVLINETRQSYRIQINYMITKNLVAVIQSDYRFLNSDPHHTRNVFGSLTYYKIPGLNISVTLSGTYIETSYMNGKILGAKISHDLFRGKFHTDLGYQNVDYILPESQAHTLQNIGEIGIYWQFAKKMSFSANYEGTFEKNNKYNRLYLQIRKRF
jgi:hypothetical protein